MNKLICFLNCHRYHYKLRLKQRHGKHYLFLLAKKICTKPSYDKGTCEVWQYNNLRWYTQNYRMQTFIDTSVKTGKWKRREARKHLQEAYQLNLPPPPLE